MEQQESAGAPELTQELLCRVLKLVPLCKAKLRLCSVNKAWKAALLDPHSHSEDLPAKACPAGNESEAD